MTRDWTPADQADAAEFQAGRDWWKRLPRDHDTDQSFCPQCGEPCDTGPSVEAFELFGDVMCADCAAGMLGEPALQNPSTPTDGPLEGRDGQLRDHSK